MADKSKITSRLSGLKGCFVAGGAITSLFTNKPINDFDIYPKSREALEDAVFWAFDDARGWNNHASSRAISFKMKPREKGDEPPDVQIMHFDTFETAYKIFEAFDFTCCMGAFDLDNEEFSKEGMWKAVNTLTFTKDPCGYATAEEAVASITDREILVFQHNQENYANFSGGDWVTISKLPKVTKMVTLEDVLREKTFFKKVVVADDHFKAPHQPHFIYRMGEEAVAVGPGLYVYNDINSARQHHVYGQDAYAVIELKPSAVEDINLSTYGNPLSGITLKKATVIAKHDLSLPVIPADLDERPF